MAQDIRGRVLSADHSKWVSNGEAAAKAREILERRIEQGRVSAQALLERVYSEVPDDTVAKGKALAFSAAPTRGVEVVYGGHLAVAHRHALGQMAQRAGVPGPYLAGLASSEEPWKRELAAQVLNEHYQRGQAEDRYLIRALPTHTAPWEVRGFLSDRFRRLDSRPLVEAFADECAKVGAVPVDGIGSDVRVSLRALLPTVLEPVPGEVIALGVEWSNSDYGAGLHSLRAFILRVWCLNGATMTNALAQVHLGRGLPDDLELSRRTYELDTRTSVSALKDVVRGLLAPRKVDELCSAIAAANEKEVDWTRFSANIRGAVLKGELAQVKDAFEGPDVYNLPAGKTAWRASNALSWVAGKTEDPERKMELQRLAGQVVDGRRDAVQAAA